MYAFLLHSNAASARLQVLSVYGGTTVMAFSNVTMTLYRWSSQSPRIIAIVVTITHTHFIPHSLPRWWDITGTEIAGWFLYLLLATDQNCTDCIDMAPDMCLLANQMVVNTLQWLTHHCGNRDVSQSDSHFTTSTRPSTLWWVTLDG